jgi:hypothetical protein
MSRYRRVAVLIAAGASFALAPAACGNEPTPASSPSATASAASPPATSSAQPQPTESTQPAPANSVTVSAAASGGLVHVTITNGLGRQIFTEDFHTDCTVVTLQLSNSASWTDVEGCRLGRPTRTIGIPAGTTYAETLDPNSFHGKFGPGTYRIRFSYHLQPDPMGDNPSTVYSATFTVS